MPPGLRTGSLQEILATRVRTTYPYRVNFKSLTSEEFINREKWCQSNCKGIWRGHRNFAEYFQFQEDSDAIMFMLKWGGDKTK